MTKEVHGTVQLPNAVPIEGARIDISLITEVSFEISSEASIAPHHTIFTNAMGNWSVNLIPNDEITPTGTLYRVKETYPTGGSKLYLIQLLTSHASMNSVLDLIVPEMSPIGIVNNFLTKGLADTLYEPIGGGSGGGPVEIVDGANNAIEATVLDLTNGNPILIAISDASGNQIASFGGGTEYVEDAVTPADPTGHALLARRRDVLVSEVSASGDWIALNATSSGQLRVRLDDVPVVDTELPNAAALADNMANPTVPAVGSHLMVFDGSTWDRGTQPLTDTQLRATPVPVSGTVTVDSELPAAAALADGTANPTVPATGAFVLLYNGTTWDRLRGDGTNGLDVDVTRIVPGTSATHLGKAEDAAHSSGDTGVFVLAVRSDSGAAFGADGDYVPFSVDAAGALRVTGGGGGTQYVEDAAAAADPTGTATILVRQDTPAALVSANGDNVARRGTNFGAAYTQILTSAGAFVDTFGGGTQYNEDDAAPANPTGNAFMLRRDDNGDDSVSADGDFIAAHSDANGNLRVNVSAALPAGTNNIGDVDVLTLPAISLAGSTNNIGDVDVLTLPAISLAASSNNIGDVDVLSVPADPFGVNADAASTTGSISAKLRSLATNINAVTAGSELQVDVLTLPNVTIGAAIPAGTNNIGDVDVLSLPALPAGSNNIGDVDVLTLPSIPAGSNNIGDVDVLTLPNVTLAAGTNTNEIVGDVAEDVALAGNPVRVGVRAHDAVPTAMSANGDIVTPWGDRSGAQVVIPHLRLIRLTATPTISTSGYVTNDQVGGLLTFTSAALASDRPFQIVQAQLTSRTVNTNRLRLHLFSDSPTIASSDNAAYDLTDANSESGIPIPSIDFLTADYEPSASNTKCSGTLKAGPVTQFSLPVGDANLYGVLQMLEASPTQYAGTTDIIIAVWVQQY